MAVDVRTNNSAPNPLDALIRTVANGKDRGKAWVDHTSYPWSDDDFSERYVRRANYQELYGMKETGDDVEELIALLGVPAKSRILDLCAGNGRHSIAMALRGYRMTGLDVGPGPVTMARETARNLGLSIDMRLIDVREISFEDAFDAAYLVCAGMSDFSPEDMLRVLDAVQRALVPGGKFLGEFLDASASFGGAVRTWCVVEPEASLFVDGPHLQLEERVFDAETSAELARSYVVPADGKVREFARCRQYYTESAARSLMAQAHLEPVAVSPGSAPGIKRILAKKA